MKILIINSRYFLSAGPERYMFSLIDLLKRRGHEIIVFSTKNSKNEKSEYEKYFVGPIGGEDKVYFDEYKKDLKTSLQIMDRQLYSNEVKRKLDRLIKDTKPDIAYILHHQNKLSPSVIDACKENKLPIVLRLSDFFLVCPESHFYTNGDVCKRCVGHSLLNAVRYKCIKNSYSASLLKVIALSFHRLMRFYHKIDYFVSPSLFSKEAISSYFEDRKIYHIPTFIDRKARLHKGSEDYVLIVSRIEPHKGIMTAVKAFENTNHKLKIVGNSSTRYDEEIKSYIQKNNLNNIEMLGSKYGEELMEIYQKSRFVLIPAEWYENMPNVALEAMASGKAILSSSLGSLKEIIRENYNGIFFEAKNVDDLKEKVKFLFENRELCRKMGENALREVTLKYNPDLHCDGLIELFEKAIQENKSK